MGTTGNIATASVRTLMLRAPSSFLLIEPRGGLSWLLLVRRSNVTWDFLRELSPACLAPVAFSFAVFTFITACEEGFPIERGGHSTMEVIPPLVRSVPPLLVPPSLDLVPPP